MTYRHDNMAAGRLGWALGMLVLLLAGLHLPVERTASAEDASLWSFAWVTDTQTPECKWITALMSEVKANRPKMLLHTGDTRFEWANRCAWRDILDLLRIETPPIEFHLAPGDHDLTNGVLKRHLRRSASEGVYPLDTGKRVSGKGYYQGRVVEYATGAEWPVWNPDVVNHPSWQASANRRPEGGERIPYHYVFKRGGIRFIVCSTYYSHDQRDWIRNLIVQPDDSSVTIVLHHKHEVNDLARYFEGLEGRHNVKLVLSGDHPHYCYEERGSITYITAASMYNGPHGECDAMTMWVYKDHLRLDRHVLVRGRPMKPIEKPNTIWTCKGRFSEYRRPAMPARIDPGEKSAPPDPSSEARPRSQARTLSPNLLYNGDFDNGAWYERYRGWAPTGWYQWFRPPHAPEHVAEKRIPHSGDRYVRIHMWAHAWCGGILQNVRGVQPCHFYRLTGYGFYQPAGDPDPEARIGIEPCGKLAEQFSVSVLKHPAPKYSEAIGDNPKTRDVKEPGLPDTTVWSDYHEDYTWRKFEVSAEARSDTITAILYCDPQQRSASQPIYEMNWDTFALREIPWPTRRLVADQAVLAVDDRVEKVKVTVQLELDTAQVNWGTTIPAGASQVLYRFLKPGEANRQQPAGQIEELKIQTAEFPFETPVVYEQSARHHWIEIDRLSMPRNAVELEVVALSRVLADGECATLSSIPCRIGLR